METKFFICEHCGNLVEMVASSGVPMMCCGKKMTEIEAGVVEASAEKHLPVIAVDGNLVRVSVGAVAHPMAAEHSILWVYLKTDKGCQRKALTVGGAPVVTFALVDEKPLAAYAYCNLHGLWMTAVEEEPVCPVEEAPASPEQNYKVCNCNNVSYFDILNALHDGVALDEVVGAFEHVKDTTKCSTGCGGCHDKVLEIISKQLG